ncbi:hypothetical protein FocTR4_00016574 [Fusarium oxysporum f. sp. cubense]|uniref:F-box domain-containing protein n=1 Tax=Fusarium oxysporum f. sp. cubense TaxID=61366 RepID=A0A5C6SE55_FUSOC|nr:hypothetical protein FocTR4_00016574 [Fusarium oxysporum f. sp. cubense]
MASSTPDISCILPRLPQELTNAISHNGMGHTTPFRSCIHIRKFPQYPSLQSNRSQRNLSSQVTEIIWDDARLFTGPERWQYKDEWEYHAFKYGLQRFTSLKRITITPATHGRHGTPLYRTPMIRAFPPGFDYPIPKVWPTAPMNDSGEWQDELPWISEEGDAPYQWFYGAHCTAEKYREKWRGYQLVSRALIECENQVTELRIKGHEIKSGLSCRIFDQPCTEYEDICTLLRRPGFQYLDLDLFTGLIEHDDWATYKTGLLRDALAQAKDLQHLCVSASTDIEDAYCQQHDPDDLERPVFPLRTIFLIDHWPRLQHFGISNFLIEIDDLVDVLSALPPTLRSVELINLAFRNPDHGYGDLIRQIRDTLDWRLRPAEERPKVHMVCSGESNPQMVENELIEVDDAVCSYLYGDGENLFEPESRYVSRGRGAVRRDVFNPAFRAPY